MKFKEALEKSVKLLSSPEFKQRVKEESDFEIQHLNDLKEINKHGFLTLSSQGGHKISGISPLDGKHYQMIERAYLEGFMLEKEASEFIQRCSMTTDKNVIFVPYCNDNVYIPRELDFPLTISKKGKETLIYTSYSSALPKYVWEAFRKESHINKTEKIVFILCWDSKWNRNASGPSGLFKDVLRVLKNLHNETDNLIKII